MAGWAQTSQFDHLWETKKVADALKIPVAGGEQEFSMFLGVEAVFTENASVIFELRFIDELAITLGAGYVF